MKKTASSNKSAGKRSARKLASEPIGGGRGKRSLLFFLPAIWLGLIIGISLIEAPLKFTAPGITIPLGLGIGRRVFFAMNIVEVILAVVLITTLVRLLGRPSRQKLWGLGIAISVVLAIKILVIRPILNIRTDAVLAGNFAGGSTTHYFYVAADAALFILLITFMVVVTRRLLPKNPQALG